MLRLESRPFLLACFGNGVLEVRKSLQTVGGTRDPRLCLILAKYGFGAGICLLFIGMLITIFDETMQTVETTGYLRIVQGQLTALCSQ